MTRRVTLKDIAKHTGVTYQTVSKILRGSDIIVSTQVRQRAAAEETFKVNAKISYLSLLGNVAPLLGLLGTVTGMISSFQVIETLKSPTPGDLAKGVYESLVNTTLGLFIAIVFLVAYFVFKNKVQKLTLSINLQAVDLLKHLAPNEAAH
jgi:biopolymer transport protein ExbB